MMFGSEQSASMFEENGKFPGRDISSVSQRPRGVLSSLKLSLRIRFVKSSPSRYEYERNRKLPCQVVIAIPSYSSSGIRSL